MSPILYGVAFVLTVVPMAASQCTTSRCAEHGYEPPRWENGALYLEALLSETSRTLLNDMEARLAVQSEAMETRLTKAIEDKIATMTTSLEGAFNTRMDAIQESRENGTNDIATKVQFLAARLAAQSGTTEVIDDRFATMTASLAEALNTRMETFERSIANGTKDITSVTQCLTEKSETMETRLANLIDGRFASMTVTLEGALNSRMDAIEESQANGTNDCLTKMQALAEQSTAMETRLTDKTVVLETRLAQHEGAIKAHLTRAVDEKYESLTETLEETIRNDTCPLVPKMQDLSEQSMAVEKRMAQLEDTITAHLTRTIDRRCASLTATLGEVNDGFIRRVDVLQERMVTEMRKLENIVVERLTNETQMALAVTEHGLKDSSAPSNITVSDLLHSSEGSLISYSTDTSEQTTETYTTLGAEGSEFLPGQTVVFLRRMDGSVNFTRPWADYKAGFGNHGAEFWLGLDTLHALTTQRQYKLRVELTDWSGERKWEVHSHFSVGGESDKYRLSVSGYDSSLSTTRSDYLHYNNGRPFSTIDNDNDQWSGGNCAIRDKGGWWYRHCHSYNRPTGVYRPAGYTGYHYYDGGIRWRAAYNDFRPFKELTLKLIPV